MAKMQLVDKVNKAIEKQNKNKQTNKTKQKPETTIGVYLDLSKAFDTQILYKLRSTTDLEE